MKGKDIAANLRGSRRKWRPGALYREGAFCVLGLKAFEAGVPCEFLRDLVFNYEYAANLYGLNDNSSTKEELIRRLESSQFRNTSFPVERFIRDCKKRMAREAK